MPDGWHHGGWLVTKPRVGEDVASVSVQFWEVQYLYGHPCQWDGTQFNPGDTVDELADALTGIPMRNATEPTQVTIGGYSGKYVEWTVPSDLEFDEEGNAVGCDDRYGPADFVSWTGRGMASNRYHQGAGQVDRVDSGRRRNPPGDRCVLHAIRNGRGAGGADGSR